MPLKSRFGFIFNTSNESSDKITKTVAHEFGHGAFQLKHTFNNKYGIEKNTTQNLMDYKGGIEFVKYQWDVIHDPQNKLFNWMQDEKEGEARTKVKFQRLSSNDNFYDENGNSSKSRDGHHISIPLSRTRAFLIHNLDTTNNFIHFSNTNVSLDTLPVLSDSTNKIWTIKVRGDIAGNCNLIVKKKSDNSTLATLNTHVYNITNIHNGNIYIVNIPGAFNLNNIITRTNYLFSPLAVNVNIASLNNVGAGINYDVNNSNYLEMYPGIDMNSADNTELNVIRNITGTNFTWKDLILVDKNIRTAWKVRENVLNNNDFIVVEQSSGIVIGNSYKIQAPNGSNSESFSVSGIESNVKMEFSVTSGSFSPPVTPNKLIYDLTKIDSTISSGSTEIRLNGDISVFVNNQTLKRSFPSKQINLDIIKYEIIDSTNTIREEFSLSQNPTRINDSIFTIRLTVPFSNSYSKKAKIVVSYLTFSRVNIPNRKIFVRGSTYGLVNMSLRGKTVKFSESDANSFTLSNNFGMLAEGNILLTSTKLSTHNNNEIIVVDRTTGGITAGYSSDHSTNRPTILSSMSLSTAGITLNNNVISFIYTHENGHGFGLKDVGLNGNVMKYNLDNTVINNTNVNSFLFKTIELVRTGEGTPLGIYQNQWNDFNR